MIVKRTDKDEIVENIEQTTAPTEEHETKQQSSDSDALVVIPRATLNYILIAIVFMVLGVLVGAAGYERFVVAEQANDIALIDRAVATALEARDGSGAGGEVVLGADMQDALNEAVERAIRVASGQPDPDAVYDVAVAGNPALGNVESPIVTIVEFSDFRCGFCGTFALETLGRVIENYGDRVQVVYRDFPVLSPESINAALAAGCADDQGQFWQFHDAMFANQEALGEALYMSTAEELGLDMETFTTCYEESHHEDNVRVDAAEAQQLGVTGTPTFYINGKLLVGAQPYEVFAATIEEQIALAEQSDQTQQ